MKKIDNSKVLCGVLFALLVLILIVAIVRKGKLWEEEESFHANFFQPGPGNSQPTLNQMKNLVINQVQNTASKCSGTITREDNCYVQEGVKTCEVHTCDSCGKNCKLIDFKSYGAQTTRSSDVRRT